MSGYQEFSESERAVLARYVSNLDQTVFALKNLPEEVIAVLFAYYSRSPHSLRQNLLKLVTDEALGLLSGERGSTAGELSRAKEQAKKFHEKWVIGYGHASVAEHGVAHLALEDVSILASKAIEDTRLASFTEKSTRYVQFERDRYLKPPTIMRSSHASLYVETAEALLEAYVGLAGTVKEKLRRLYPPAGVKRPRAYESALGAKACDLLRHLLPAATLTNLGMTINGRSLEGLISKLLTHPLEEVRGLGAAVHREGVTILPTLLKHAGFNRYRAETTDSIDAIADEHFSERTPLPGQAVSLIRYTPNADEELVASILYPFSRLSLSQLRAEISTWSHEEKARVVTESLERRGAHDNPIRAMEHISYTFDLLLDYGAYRDIQRHRLVSQLSQRLTPGHGYEIPMELEQIGLAGTFETLMERAADCYYKMAASLLHEAAYIVPMAYRHRVCFTLNLRELFHFIELRSAPQGHSSYRRVAREMYRSIAEVHPFIARFVRVNLELTGLERLRSEEQSQAAADRKD